MPGIFRGNDIDLLQRLPRARRQVFEITDGCRDDEQCSGCQLANSLVQRTFAMCDNAPGYAILHVNPGSRQAANEYETVL